MAQKHYHIPGLEEAIAQERELRNEIYLNAPRDICGVSVSQITPRIHCALLAARSPFLCGGSIGQLDVIYFLWICSPGFSTEQKSQSDFVEKSLGIDLDEAVVAIDQFVSDTYMDMPCGGGRGKPYYSILASIEYTMSCEPFRWDYDTKTQHVPLRRIYQLMNVARAHKGAIISNPISDKIQQRFIDDLNEDAMRNMEGRN